VMPNATDATRQVIEIKDPQIRWLRS